MTEIHDRLSALEQEVIQLEFFLPPTEENQVRLKSILAEMQPLYKQLGGIYTSKKNLNYGREV